MTDLNVVQLHDGPSLQDIPAQLRALADRIEAGQYGQVETLITMMPKDGDFPTMWGWGDIAGQRDPIIQLNLALHWHCASLTARSP